MAPKKDRSNYVFRNKSDQVLIKKPGDLEGADFAIANCSNCEIYIFDHLAQVHILKTHTSSDQIPLTNSLIVFLDIRG